MNVKILFLICKKKSLTETQTIKMIKSLKRKYDFTERITEQFVSLDY